MKKKIFALAIVATVAVAGAWGFSQSNNEVALSDVALSNVEALAANEGSKCSNGCSDIGWGTSKILECDCNYDHFSCCNRWGC